MPEVKDDTAVVDPAMLIKSYDGAVSTLKKLLKAKSVDDDMDEEDERETADRDIDEKRERRKKKLRKALRILEKAKKKDWDGDDDGDSEDDDDTEFDEDEREEEEHENGGMESQTAKGTVTMHKSLVGEIAGDDPQSEISMDVSPFLKSFARRFDARLAALEDSQKQVKKLTKALAKMSYQNALLQKSLMGDVQAIGKTPVATGSVRSMPATGAGLKTKPGIGGTKPQMTNRRILEKSFDLLTDGKITPIMATKIEARVNKNLPLPEEVAPLFADLG